MNLTALGVGAIIGTGIFVLTGTVAAQTMTVYLSSPSKIARAGQPDAATKR